MSVDPKLVILTISNQINGNELFRVHVHELSIRFDDKFQNGIENNYQLKQEIEYLNDLWKDQKIKQSQIFPIMLDIIYRYGDYLKDFFFDDSDLDKNGQFVEKPKYESEPQIFFNSLKKQSKLNKITKKEFQFNIKNIKVAEKYVDCFVTKSKYYSYQLFKTEPMKERWFFMEYNDQLIFCYKNK
jgi:hypothetical protein